MKDARVVVISSTARDLPEYRKQVMDACHRSDMVPRMMEHLPAMAADAIQASLDLVNQADVYIGVFAQRYGHVPEGHDISITQMEYERAIERGIPRLIFLMHDDVPVTVADIDFENKPRLDALKRRLTLEQVVAFFRNPDDLRALVLQSLGALQKQLDAVRTDEAGRPTPAALAQSLHYISEIPQPPEPYIAHPYTLLQVRRLVGRKDEMELLTDWVTGKRFTDVRIFSVVAIGGMGKSALTWTWFNEVAPQEMSPLAGRLWWSFYESDARFENFVTRALAYVSRRPLDEVKQLPVPEQEDLLLRHLDREPFLIVLDGLERILTAYARLDAAYLRDEGALDEATANRVAGVLGLPESAGQSFVGKHKLRMTAAPRAGRFLRKLSRVRASRILISTRLYPADLQAPGGKPSPYCFALFLTGLSDQDALALWRAYGARGSREVMLPVFRTFDKHPLLLQLLAYEVAEFREAPGDFDNWSIANPDFNPFGMELANVQSHVLQHSMRGLAPAELRTLHVIAGFRMPASMQTLKALLLSSDKSESVVQQPFTTLGDLDRTLTILEDRGLLGWDRRSNRYDLHPIVRGVVWTSLDDGKRIDLYGTMRAHFEAIPPVADSDVESLNDVTPTIELFHALIRLNLYDDAFLVYKERLHKVTSFRLGAGSVRVQILQELFPNGPESPSQLTSNVYRTFALNALALAYDHIGQPHTAASILQALIKHPARSNEDGTYRVNLSRALYSAGHLREAETLARAALVIARAYPSSFSEAVTLQELAFMSGGRGNWNLSKVAFERSERVFERLEWHMDPYRFSGRIHFFRGQVELWHGNAENTKEMADKALRNAERRRYEVDFIRSARLLGTAALHLDHYATAAEQLHYTLRRARSVSLVEEELPTLVALAELHRQQGEYPRARTMLEDVWDAAERGPYPLFHADALNVLAQIERDVGNTEAAVDAATKAYRLAWCDGPPFAYHWGLEKAKAHLAALGAPEPEMPPFDESQHEPMPEVEINPPDEFGGGDEVDADEAE